MITEIWIVEYEFESLVGKDHYEWRELTIHGMIDKVFVLYQSMTRI
jgi:hypothetical protein